MPDMDEKKIKAAAKRAKVAKVQAAEKNTKGLNRIRNVFIVVLVVLSLIVAGFSIGYFTSDNDNLLKKGKVTHVSFGKGLTTSEYSKMLYEAGLISNEGEFNDMVREHDAAKQLKPGVYTFEGGMEVEDIFNQIVEGPNTQLVIPEGASLQEVADLVEETYGGAVKSERMMEKFTNLDEYLKDYPFLEGKEDMDGYILPGTYNTQAFGLMEFDTARANLITRQLLDHYVEVNGEA